MSRLRTLQNQISTDFSEILKSDTKGKPWTFSLGSGMSHTTNADLKSSGARGDFYTTNTMGVRRQADLADGYAVSSGVLVTDYRYVRYPKLSMTFLDWDVMLSRSGTTSSGFDLEGYLSHTLEWTQQQTFQFQTFSSIVALGGSVSRKIRPGHAVSLASELSVTPFTSPSENGYGCLSLSTSYNWTMLPSVTLNLTVQGYETLYFGGERDFTTSCSATVTWAITSWLSASAFASPSWNSSTTKGSSYSVVDSGINVSANWKF